MQRNAKFHRPGRLLHQVGLIRQNFKSAPGKSLRHCLGESRSSAHFENCLKSSGKITSIVAEYGSPDANLRRPKRRFVVCPKTMVKAPVADFVADRKQFRESMWLPKL